MEADKNKSAQANLKGKLRLQKNISDSCQTTLNLDTKTDNLQHHDQEIYGNKRSPQKENTSRSPNAEDTLADFKSPKSKTASKLIIDKFKIDKDKGKRKIIKTKNKSNVKSRKSTSDIKQPSIESSFFKPQISNQSEIKESVPCPLCLHPLKDDAACNIHMKLCAAKNKVSITQLLEAKKLQDRQAEERKAMGLLARPVLSERKKAFRSKKYSTDHDPQLQLVLALSESLYQAEQIVELEQAALLAGIPSECIKSMNEEERKTTLKNFGFTSSRPATDIPTSRAKRKKLVGPTILQTRSQEDKDRVLTERIACILTGDDALTQAQQETQVIFRNNEPIQLLSKNLQEIRKTSDKLWDKSRLRKQHDFYVKDLRSHFLPLDQQVKTAQLQDASQIFNIINNDDTEDNAVQSNISIEYEPFDIDIITNKEPENIVSDLSNVNECKGMDRELEFMRSLLFKWREALNDSAASDLIIHVKNEKYIYVHKLVFHVQCSNVLLDIEPNDSISMPGIKEQISWIKFEEQSALAFLEFIYCGNIHKNTKLFESNSLLSEVNQLARLYQIPGLFTYLRKRQKEFKTISLPQIKTPEKDRTNRENNTHEVNIDKPSNTPAVQTKEISDSMLQFKSDPLPLLKNNSSINILKKRRMTASPDLFDSENEEENSYSKIIVENRGTKGCENDTNLKILVDLIDADETQITGIILNNQNESSKNISSQKTIVNLSGIASPERDISLSYSPTRDIHGTVTPRNRSPNIDDDRTPERSDRDNEDIHPAVTSKIQRLPNTLNESVTGRRDCDQITEAITPVTGRSPEMNVNSTFEEKDLKNNDISKATTPEFDIMGRLKDYVTQQRPVYTNISVDEAPADISSHENDAESMYTAVTPPRPNNTDDEPIIDEKVENIKKLKTDLSLFIDKVRKANAKSVLDTDSETDTPNLRLTRKNPFLKQHRDDSYRYLRKDGKERRVISLLEQDLLRGQNVNLSLNQTTRDSTCSNILQNGKPNDLSASDFSSLNLSSNFENQFVDFDKYKNKIDCSSKSIDKSNNKLKVHGAELLKNKIMKPANKINNSSISDDEILDVTMNESEMSMYSKYKKQNKHHNSIAKYRKGLNFEHLTTNNPKESDAICDGKIDVEKNLQACKSTKNNNKSILNSVTTIDDVTLVSDSDDEQENISSIQKDCFRQNHFTFQTRDKSNASHLRVDVALTNNEDDNIFPLNFDNNRERFTSSKVISSVIVDKTKSNRNVIDLSNDSDEENGNAMSSIIGKPLHKNETEDIDDEINNLLQNSPEFNTQKRKNENQSDDEITEATRNKNLSIHNEVINLSPISIISSPESSKIIKEKLNTPSRRKSDEFRTIDNDNIEDETFQSGWISKHSLKVNETNKSIKPSQSSQILSLLSSPILCENSPKLLTTTILTSEVKIGQKRKSQSPKEMSKETRKLQTKSASFNYISEKPSNNSNDSLQRSSSYVTPNRNKYSSQNAEKHVKNMTPPTDYNQLDTPELHKELKKFGLKPQKRNKATLLLTHIYNETHPVSVAKKRPSSTDSSGSDESPPLKRQIFKKSCKKSILKPNDSSGTSQSIRNCYIIDEEIDYDVPDAPVNFVDNPVSIKNAFTRLLETNKELHAKVLTYEPLSLESLHTMLKENGFKCKINTLMDFLDEQCITFQVQNGKGNRTKKKERRK